jgi:hypothetical protein
VNWSERLPRGVKPILIALIIMGVTLVWAHNLVLLTRIVMVSRAWRPEIFTTPSIVMPEDETGISSLYAAADSGFVYEPSFRDPFSVSGSFGGGSDERQAALTLKGVLWSPTRPLAVVEDATGTSYRVEEGDPLGEARVVSILVDGIVLDKGGGEELLKVWEQ